MPRIMVQSVRRNSTSIWSICLLFIFFLLFAHLSVKTFFPNPVFWIFGAIAIVTAGTWWLAERKDTFGFLLAVFACAHFAFGDYQGGFWSYVLIGVTLTAILLKYRLQFRITSVPKWINWLLFIFLAHQFVGLLLNPYSLVSNIQSLIVTCSYLVVFYGCASLIMSETRLKSLLAVWFITASWVFIMALNQKYHWLITSSPVLPQLINIDGSFAEFTAASFYNTELFAEYFCIVFTISMVVIMHLKELAPLRIKMIFPLIMILLGSAAIMMGGARSAILLAAASTGYILLNNIVLSPLVQKIKNFLLIVLTLFICTVFVLEFGAYFSLDRTTEDLNLKDLSEMTIESVISGESIKRSYVYFLAYQRLREKSWWIGYGFNLPENNIESMGIKGLLVSDFHSLYLMLPIYYGWIGSAAFVLLVLCTGLRSYLIYFKNRKFGHFLVPVALGFALLWGVFLLDQFKISATRNASYFLLTWFWLGWTHSVANTLKSNSSNVQMGRKDAIRI